jgi:hypothetical protein
MSLLDSVVSQLFNERERSLKANYGLLQFLEGRVLSYSWNRFLKLADSRFLLVSTLLKDWSFEFGEGDHRPFLNLLVVDSKDVIDLSIELIKLFHFDQGRVP